MLGVQKSSAVSHCPAATACSAGDHTSAQIRNCSSCSAISPETSHEGACAPPSPVDGSSPPGGGFTVSVRSSTPVPLGRAAPVLCGQCVTTDRRSPTVRRGAESEQCVGQIAAGRDDELLRRVEQLQQFQQPGAGGLLRLGVTAADHTDQTGEGRLGALTEQFDIGRVEL